VVAEMDIRRTALFPGVGGDGGHVDPDCTHS
jgi:hypothetical protein